uniref:Probable exo-1,4-beta-xylosidase bxlB n=2 Tax=Aspergillus clavatus (strain ATCC 1007 / CBS 513.65 / DSM 816 / NCTC 3887 / NRRL 1 / QM 1276 / 107) TaxID=344612 RepID=BXLB_ASPCL|nr:RecName: Full=Probable exo-1,4-beta-xylosidase bxlB; AltName: Full=1,4-beta-D-xylan xylohydrolase bxlB; AltName: Full=Beta-xylosidase bxlB; AltName: Full=Xylobiase bxlB; Flags: Precursor [Aspergillus clavatus NRRL 1]
MVGLTPQHYGNAIALMTYLASTALADNKFPDCTSGPLSKLAVCDTSRDVTTRAQSLVDAMSFAEKVNNTQYEAPGVPRLGLPAYNWWSEALHGVAGAPGVHFADSGPFSYATSFAQPILLGASFDDELVKQVATVVGTEGRAFGNAGRAGLDYWTPNINPFRDPRWGRGQETPGEDPLHVSRYVYHLVDGLQGGIGPARPQIAATCKHFAAYDMEDWNGVSRHEFDARVSTQDLAEFYLPSFKSCVRDAQVDAVMCSYNALNGVPTCADPYLLQTLLREHWDWDQPGHWVVSDCGAIDDIYIGHNYTKTGAEAAAVALNAGTDLDCGTVFPKHLGEAAEQGLYTNQTLDRALVRLYSSLVKLGYFDPAEKQPYGSIGWKDVDTPAAEQLAHKAAVEGIVLLKNDQTLPLKAKGTLALIGPYANATKQMQGNYQGPPKYIRTLEWAATQHGYQVQYSPGTAINNSSTAGFAAALAAAKDADVVLYAGGIDNTIESETLDRTTITWPGNQLSLISELSNLHKPLIVIQFGGGQVDDTPLLTNPHVNALLWAGYPSQEGGAAIFDILTGKAAPAGRLPITQYPAAYTAQVPMTEMGLRAGGDNPGRTYRWYDKAVVPFGFGLHYTSFEVSWDRGRLGPYNTAALVNRAPGGSHVDRALFDTFRVQVQNTGTVTSDYVALLFVKTEDAGPEPYPLKTLVGYTRVQQVKPGERRSVEIEVTLGAMARTAANGDLVLYPGKYTLQVDVGERGYPTARVSVHGKEVVLDHFPQPPEGR